MSKRLIKFLKTSQRAMLSLFCILGSLSVLAAPVAEKNTSAPARTALDSPEDQTCQSAYRKIFGKDVVQIKMIFGYKDTRPSRFVGDRHERLAFVQRILAACSSNRSTGQFTGRFTGREDCGFTRDSENADLFTKIIVGPMKHPVKIELTVANSSVGSDDASNRENPFQKWQSNYAKTKFLNSLEQSDIVFYNGHSRFGGGPDFEPPVLAEDGEVLASYYKGKQPGLQAIQEKLRSRRKAEASGGGLKVLGLFSCASSQHFSDQVGRESKAAFISSQALIYYKDALDASLASLSSLLEMRCESDFKTALKNASPKKILQVDRLF